MIQIHINPARVEKVLFVSGSDLRGFRFGHLAGDPALG